MTLKEMLERAQQKMEAARAIVSNPSASADEKASVPALMAEAKLLKADADLLMTIDREGGALAEAAKGVSEAKRQQDAPKGFKYWGEFLQAAHVAKMGGKTDPRLSYFQDEPPTTLTRTTKDMSGETGAGGGYLIPEQFRATLMAAMAESGIVRSRATVIPMSSRSIRIPALNQTQSLAEGRPRWFGGLTFDWIGEGESKPASDAAFRDIELVAKKLVGFTRASDELLTDAAISLEAFLSGPLGFAGGAVWMEDYAFLRGTGVAQPLGILNSPALLTVNRDVAGKVRYNDLARMLAAALPSADLTWVISQTVLIDLMLMEDPEGNYIWGSATQGENPRLLGRPYVITEKLPAHGTTGDVLLADFSYYLIGDRQATTVESTKFEAWQYDKTSWRMIHRVDGQPWLNAPLTYQDTTTQVSPFVALSSDVS